jgi:hypothetical protein
MFVAGQGGGFFQGRHRASLLSTFPTPGIVFQVTRTAAMPMGRLMRKIHRQLSAVSNPPITGPMEPAAAPLTAHTRTPRLTRSGGSVVRTRPRLAGMIIAAPAACTHRNPTRTHKSGAYRTGQARHGENGQPEDEGGLAPVLVGEAAGGDKERPEEQGVGVEHPGNVGERGLVVQTDADVVQGDVDDEEVE